MMHWNLIQVDYRIIFMIAILLEGKLLYMSRVNGKMFENVTTTNDPKKQLYGDVVELF